VTGPPSFLVVVCTRDRPAHLATTIAALDAQSWKDFEVLVVDQSRPPNPVLADRAADDPRLRVICDTGVGLSRSRNLACRQAATDWLVYLDDDCRPEPGWAAALQEALSRAGDVDMVTGAVGGAGPPATGDYLEVTTYAVVDEAVISGRWTPPWKVGLGVCMAVRRSSVERLGGWDERLGVGSEGPFGAAEDVDLNYRLLRSGGKAMVTPTVRVWHEQWRAATELAPLYERYMAGWCGFAMKHLRGGDIAGGLWLWGLGLTDALRMLASAGRRRSRLRLHVGLAKLRGLVVGTVAGVTRRW